CYIPRETPRGLIGLRKEESERMRGYGESGERKEWDRIYEYEVYNDLGDPQNPRPVLGRSRWYPYPRRLRTGRQPASSSMSSESRPESMPWSIYVPADERCSPKKLKELQSKAVQAFVYFVIPELKLLLEEDSDDEFQSFQEILNLFSPNRDRKVEGSFKDTIKNTLVPQLANAITRHASQKSPVHYPLPQIISENEWAWMDDMEFARQMVAGIHPLRIKRLKRFPPHSKNGVDSSIESTHIEHNLEGLTLLQAMQEGRILILDHHDYLIPFLNRINTNGVCAYASRTFLLLRNDGMLKPLAIELSLPPFPLGNEQHRVFLPAEGGVEAALWQLAKAHVAANDNLYHQLISHWLHTHAVVEPFIIATRRQLSVMHPIHRILNPHFRDTIHINALARCILIDAEGILEKILLSGEISMEMSSELYKEWRFTEQGLPADLIKRGLAIEDPDVNNPAGILFLLEDYPYAIDGLEIWVAIKQWVKDFCSFFYKDDDAVKSDIELQAWWTEIQNVGHGDKRNETWWIRMTTLPNLVEALTTLIWIASAMHASLNYGQYVYSGYPPGRPTLCRQFIPDEGTHEFGEFLKDPDKFFLKMLPGRFEMSLAVALVEVLSQHACDEVYLGCQPSPEWIDNDEVRKRFAQFGEELKKIQTRILSRNNEARLRNRRGPAKMTYNLLYPNTTSSGSKGVTGRGIPNSISI
ncbi:linoleate 9S-lipoxygenase 5-like, partial [Neltuma alba]|uniref:linoleate 9S-lipoxygenase 5-like n=1 Tax=Neltuma alba TaxID=207710 RepID=UPI0010A4B59B